MADTKPDEVPVREFASFILDLPAAHEQLGKAIQDVIGGVLDTGKAGSITLKLGIKMLPGGDNVIIATPTITVVKPKAEIKAGVFYADRNNNPQRNDPTMEPLFTEDLRDVNTETGEMKEPPAAPAPKSGPQRDIPKELGK